MKRFDTIAVIIFLATNFLASLWIVTSNVNNSDWSNTQVTLILFGWFILSAILQYCIAWMSTSLSELIKSLFKKGRR